MPHHDHAPADRIAPNVGGSGPRRTGAGWAAEQGGAVERLGILTQRRLCCCPPAIKGTVSFRRNAILVASLALLGSVLYAQAPSPELHFHALVPLGAEAYPLRGDQWKTQVTLLASAENPQFEGMVRRDVNHRDELFAADGTRVQSYPERVNFRVTASLRTRLVEASPFPMTASVDVNDYLLHLKFRVVIFDGLRQTVVEPESVEMIGMPDEVPYDERIYRVTVDLPHIPVRDRVVLEVRDPDGDRICKFHLDLL